MKRLTRKHVPLDQLFELVDLVVENTPEAQRTLADRFRLHKLHGEWRGSFECHVDGAGDWLVIWREQDGQAVFQRTGSHDELF